MTENDRKILARACGVFWHEYIISPDGKSLSSCLCGNTGMSVREICAKENPTFATPDDWEMVRVKVVLSREDVFSKRLHHKHHEYMCNQHPIPFASWLLTRSPETLCQLACDFIKSRPDLFPWVREMEVE